LFSVRTKPDAAFALSVFVKPICRMSYFVSRSASADRPSPMVVLTPGREYGDFEQEAHPQLREYPR